MENNKQIIGFVMEYHPDDEIKDPIYREDLKTDDPDRMMLVKEWVGGLANPWSDSAVSYMINNVNYRPNIPENEQWEAKYNSIFYDCLESVAIANGSTPEEALNNVNQLVQNVIEQFHDASIEED